MRDALPLLLLAIPLAGGLLAWAVAARRPAFARWICLGALLADLALALRLWFAAPAAGLAGAGGWLLLSERPWVPRLGIGLRFGIDGLSLLMVLLTLVLGILALAGSWRQVQQRVGFFSFNVMAVLTGVLGVFLALDLVLFYFFWELMLVPMVFLIGIWGHQGRVRAAVKFFLFTQAGGLLMLLAILGLAFARFEATGELSFSYLDLLGTEVEPSLGRWLFLGFFLAFAVKLPALGLHTWLPEAHAEAPTAGSVILAGLMLKTGAYGLLRFAVPFFPELARVAAPWAMALGALGVLYGGWLAFAQTDLKRLVAYTSVSHLGFVLLGLFAWNRLALQGVVLQILCHGFATGGLFLAAGWIEERFGSRDLDRLGGLWSRLPRLGGAGTFLAMAALGLPGLGTFVAEVLILAGTFRVSPLWASVAAVGLVVATAYSLRFVQAVFHGPLRGRAEEVRPADLGRREMAVFAALALLLLWIGLYPAPLLDTAGPTVASLVEENGGGAGPGSEAEGPPPEPPW